MKTIRNICIFAALLVLAVSTSFAPKDSEAFETVVAPSYRMDYSPGCGVESDPDCYGVACSFGGTDCTSGGSWCFRDEGGMCN